MNYDYDTVKRNIAANISYYRKKLNLTQLELAEKINYSDKLVSSWERAERTPDIFTLKELSAIFGVTVDDLTRARKVRMARPISKQTLAFLYALIPWVVIGIIFVVLQLAHISFPDWHLLIYAVTASSLIIYIFNLVWRKIWLIYISLTVFIWTLALSLFISFGFNAIYFISAAPIYIFSMFLMYYLIHLSLKTK
ncbi:MAG TPA: helix-turn-helix transcriptional regulator [Bacilli bacterium]|nr:helix-turn-helix transcriptional regulator [Bacilli bacterium]